MQLTSNFRVLKKYTRRQSSSEMLGRVVWQKLAVVSQLLAVSIIRSSKSLVSGTRFESGISQIRSKSGNICFMKSGQAEQIQRRGDSKVDTNVSEDERNMFTQTELKSETMFFSEIFILRQNLIVAQLDKIFSVFTKPGFS